MRRRSSLSPTVRSAQPSDHRHHCPEMRASATTRVLAQQGPLDCNTTGTPLLHKCPQFDRQSLPTRYQHCRSATTTGKTANIHARQTRLPRAWVTQRETLAPAQDTGADQLQWPCERSLGHLTTTDAQVNCAGGSGQCRDEVARVEHLTHQFRERVDLGWLERLGLGNQVLVASRPGSRNDVHRDRGSRTAVVGRSELVNNGRHTSGRVLRGLCVLNSFAGNEGFDSDCHVVSSCWRSVPSYDAVAERQRPICTTARYLSQSDSGTAARCCYCYRTCTVSNENVRTCCQRGSREVRTVPDQHLSVRRGSCAKTKRIPCVGRGLIFPPPIDTIVNQNVVVC